MLITSTVVRKSNIEGLISSFAMFFLFACVSHQLIFCLINTHLFTVSRSLIIIFEFSLLLGASILFLTKVNIKMLTLIIFIFANIFFLAIFKNGFDPKQIRNFLIPILVIWLGANAHRDINFDKLIKVFAMIVIAFGLFEGVFSEFFQKIINVLKYQVAIGAVDGKIASYLDTSFALNGTRVGGRNFLGFLFGSHRISSIFLESASMSNVGVVIAAWGLVKEDTKKITLFLVLGLFINILSDSRFGLTIITLLILLRFFCPLNLLKVLAFTMPVFVIGLCLYVYFNLYDGFTDTFKGRLGLTGEFLSHFTISEFFGTYNVNYSNFLDSGYAFLLHNYGIVFALVMWISLYNIKTNSSLGERFKAFIAVIIAANLAIGGDAIYALKMSGLMWFLMGVLSNHKQEAGTGNER